MAARALRPARRPVEHGLAHGQAFVAQRFVHVSLPGMADGCRAMFGSLSRPAQARASEAPHLASPYDEGIAFVMKRGEDGAAAVWTSLRRPIRTFDSRAKPLDAPGGGDGPRARQDTPT